MICQHYKNVRRDLASHYLALTSKGGNIAICAICTRETKRCSGSTTHTKKQHQPQVIDIRQWCSLRSYSISLQLVRYYTYICNKFTGICFNLFTAAQIKLTKHHASQTILTYGVKCDMTFCKCMHYYKQNTTYIHQPF